MRPITVVETAPFLRHVDTYLSRDEREAFIDFIARSPEAGVLIRETGGARKVRWARDGSGKSGGVRTIYYFHDPDAPLFLLTIYGKGTKANLSGLERQAIRTAVEALKTVIRAKRMSASATEDK